MNIARLTAVLAAFTLVACKSEPCPKDYYADPGGRFCAKLPAGYKQAQEKNGPGWPSVIFEGPEGSPRVTVVLAPPDQYASQVAGQRKEGSGSGASIEEQLDIADGKGKYLTIADKQVEMHMARAAVQAPKNVLVCQSMWNDGAPTAAIDFCKSLRAQN